MKLETTALIFAGIAAGVYGIAIVVMILAASVTVGPLALLPAIPVAVVAYLFAGVVKDRLSKDDPYDKIED